MNTPEQQARKTDAQDLYVAIKRFCEDNQYHHAVEYRFLVKQVIASNIGVMAYDLYGNGIASFAEKYADGIAEVRLAEIAAEREKLRARDKALEIEAKKLTVDK